MEERASLERFFESPSQEFLGRVSKAAAALQDGIVPAFLSDEFAFLAAKRAGVSEEDAGAALSVAAMIRQDETRARLAWALQSLLSGPDPLQPSSWPKLAGPLASHEEAFNLLLVLSRVQAMDEAHESRRIPEEIRKAALSDLPLWLSKLHGESGKRGLSRRILCWFQGHLDGRLFRIGRLQFIPSKFSYPCEVFRSVDGSRTAALALDGTKVDGEGFIAEASAQAAWIATLSKSGGSTRGFLIDPSGRVSKEEASLDGSWTSALSAGDSVLDVHIPEDGPLDLAACRDSFLKGLDFFSKHFPELEPKAFICSSWLFDPCFLKILKPSSKILSFYKEFYCVPLTSHAVCTDETLWRVFGKDKERLDEAPKDNSMKKAVYEHFKGGGVFRESGGLILNGDLHAYGSMRYWSPGSGKAL